jgi:hypothetical protein
MKQMTLAHPKNKTGWEGAVSVYPYIYKHDGSQPNPELHAQLRRQAKLNALQDSRGFGRAYVLVEGGYEGWMYTDNLDYDIKTPADWTYSAYLHEDKSAIIDSGFEALFSRTEFVATDWETRSALRPAIRERALIGMQEAMDD